jgi:hypothetical protein
MFLVISRVPGWITAVHGDYSDVVLSCSLSVQQAVHSDNVDVTSANSYKIVLLQILWQGPFKNTKIEP